MICSDCYQPLVGHTRERCVASLVSQLETARRERLRECAGHEATRRKLVQLRADVTEVAEEGASIPDPEAKLRAAVQRSMIRPRKATR